MSSEKVQATNSGGKALHIARRKKKPKSVQGTSSPSVNGSQNQLKEVPPETGKSAKVFTRRPRKKHTTPSTASASASAGGSATLANANESMKHLHECTRHVIAKLKKMKQSIEQSSGVTLPDDDFLIALEKLKLSEVPVDDDGEGKDVQNPKKNKVKRLTRAERRKLLQKTKTKSKKLTEDQDNLKKIYVRHINKVVSGGNEPKETDLKFVYGEDLEKFAQKCVEEGFGRIVEGELRVNAKNNHQSFVCLDDGPDAMIMSMAARLYALEGDIVRVFVRDALDTSKTTTSEEQEQPTDETIDDDEAEENENAVQSEEAILEKVDTSSPRTRHAFVVAIVEAKGNREFVGTVSLKNPFKVDDGEYFKFRPRDMKVPMIHIPVESCKDIVADQESDDIMGLLYIAEIVDVTPNGHCIGKLKEPVGKSGNLEAEIKAILLHSGLKDVKPYEERFEKMFSASDDITYDDMEGRIDLRNECIFTIDPLTARDLDDAVSCKTLEDGNYEIGVHISDVTAYLKECSELDEIVKLRATSIYLSNEVIHMLPQSLCFKCSLLPGEEKLAFSVFWVMDEQGKIKSTRFTRSIIRSCTQFAYEHAQKIIDNPQEQFTADDFPTICGKFTVNDIIERVLILNKIAENMRSRRYLNGCLSIDNPEFYFQFDPKTGEPVELETAARYSANFLIEEFMVQANQSVASFIYKRFPDLAFLRNHQPPKQNAVNNLKAKLTNLGIDLNMETSKAIHDGMKAICEASSDPEAMAAGLNHLLTKPMMRSTYFCSSISSTPADLYHYALAIPIYTHFTSPIRRYPDVIVHRLLAAALDYETSTKRTASELSALAKICNDQKWNAKTASEESANMFFLRYVKAKSTVRLRAVVTEIHRHLIEVITIKTGHVITIKYKLQKVIVDASASPSVVYISEKNSTKPPLALKIFSPVDIVLVVKEDKLVGLFDSPDKEQRLKNNIIEKSNGKKKTRKTASAQKAPPNPDNATGDH